MAAKNEAITNQSRGTNRFTPTGALDRSTGVLVLEAIDRINRELGTTTAVITHNAVIASMADRVVSLSDGRITSVRRNSSRKVAGELEW